MSETKDTNTGDADAYYGDDNANTDELDLSFLDQDDSNNDK